MLHGAETSANQRNTGITGNEISMDENGEQEMNDMLGANTNEQMQSVEFLFPAFEYNANRIRRRIPNSETASEEEANLNGERKSKQQVKVSIAINCYTI